MLTSSDNSLELEKLLNKLADNSLLFFVVLSAPALLGALDRFGLTPLTISYSVIVTLSLIVAGFRKRILFKVKINFLLVVLAAIGTLGFWGNGPASSAYMAFISMAVLATVFWGLKSWPYVIGYTIIYFSFIAVLVHFDRFTFAIDYGYEIHTIKFMISTITAVILFQGITIAAMNSLRKFLIDSNSSLQKSNSELIEINNQLEESEKKYKELIEGIDELIIQVDIDGKIQFSNYRSIDIFGLKPSEVIGYSALDFVYKDDRS